MQPVAKCSVMLDENFILITNFRAVFPTFLYLIQIASLNGMDNKELVELLKQGDRTAFALLYRTYSEKMARICLRYVSDRQAVQDLVHDGFIIIFTSIGTLRQPDKLESWMGMIMKNLSLKYLSRCDASANTIPLSDITEEDEPTEASISDLPTYDALNAIIESLPDGYQAVFRLSVLEGLSHKEIGRILGIAPHSSSSQLAKAKKALRKLMSEYRMVIAILLLSIPLEIEMDSYRKYKHGGLGMGYSSEENQDAASKDAVKHPTPMKRNYLSIRPKQTASIPHSERKEAKDSVFAQATKPDTTRQAEDANKTIKGNAQYPIDIHAPAQAKSQWGLAITYQGGMGQDNVRTSTVPGNISSGSNEGTLTKEKSHHYMPIVFSLAVRKQIGERWGIEAGLSYTRLRSDFTAINENHSERTQKVDYIGIPLKATFNVWNYKKISVYTSAGVMLDVPLKAVYKVNSVKDGVLIKTDWQTLSPSPQWSVGAGIGIQYHITPAIGVYAEPNLHYYFKNKDNVKTIWDDRPLNVSLPIGLRFSW